jgi:hypothetical protein
MSEQQSDNTAVKIVAIIGGVILVIVLSCGVLIFFIVQAGKKMVNDLEGTFKEFAEDARQSQKAVDSFLSDVRAGKLDNAYESTTREFKEHMSRAEFEDLVKQHPALKERATLHIDMNSPNPAGAPGFPGTHDYSYRAEGKDHKNKIEFTVSVEKEDGQMKVDQLTITKEEGKDEGKAGPEGKAAPKEGTKSEK